LFRYTMIVSPIGEMIGHWNEGHLGCFQGLAVIKKMSQQFSTHLGKYQDVWLLGHMVGIYLVL
jgi:hypothetical protein